MRNITLIIPGLFGSQILVHSDDLPDLPALNWLLSHGKRKCFSSLSASYVLCELFGLKKKTAADLPIAAITRLSDSGQYPEGIWMRADPVHLSADRDSLILMDHNCFSISQEDAVALASDVNKVLEPRGMILEVPVPHRWYIKVLGSLEIVTVPLDLSVGKNIFSFMPKGGDHANLIQLLNEIQMTLHISDTNRIREQERRLPINSVWFWGYGELPGMMKRNWSFVVSDEILGRGFSMMSATPFEELPDNFTLIKALGDSYNGLIVIDAFQRFVYYHDLENWLEALIQYEQNWFAPLLKAFEEKSVDTLEIRTTDHSITLASHAKYKFWRKKKNVLAFRTEEKKLSCQK